jgi:HSP20 family protein
MNSRCDEQEETAMAGIIPRKDRTESRELERTRAWDPFRMMEEVMGWDPFRELAPLMAGQTALAFNPQFEVKETKDAYVFKADLPGLKDENVDVSLTGTRLTISGRREQEAKQESERYFTYERSYGNFSRSFTLPDGIDAERVTGELKDGVLTLVVPKKPEVQPRRIDLKGGSGSVKA